MWWLADDGALSSTARDAIANANTFVAVSAATAWEIAIKRGTGKLTAPDDFEEQLAVNGFVPLPITVADGLAAGRLPRHHDDPFDRMLVSQAQTHDLVIVTRDRRIELYGVDILRA